MRMSGPNMIVSGAASGVLQLITVQLMMMSDEWEKMPCTFSGTATARGQDEPSVLAPGPVAELRAASKGKLGEKDHCRTQRGHRSEGCQHDAVSVRRDAGPP
jgi:hypothetical protein